MIISELYLPNIKFNNVEQHDRNKVDPGSPWEYVKSVNLLQVAAQDKSFAALVAYIKPFQRISIHKDYAIGPEQIKWSILFGGHGLILEIYDAINDASAIGEVSAPNKEYQVPALPPENARLIESKCITGNPIMFNPTVNWHSVYNPTDTWIKCISLRSKSDATAEYLTSFMVKN